MVPTHNEKTIKHMDCPLILFSLPGDVCKRMYLQFLWLIPGPMPWDIGAFSIHYLKDMTWASEGNMDMGCC